jgi:hypothetical protein
LPLYLYDQSGITITVDPEPFRQIDRAGWDWGQVGFIFVSESDMVKEYGENYSSEKLDDVVPVLLGEVEVYDMYLSGEVYGYRIFSPDKECKACHGDVNIPCDCGDEVGCGWGIYGREYVERFASEEATHVE